MRLHIQADPGILSSSGQTPLQMATARGHTGIVEILQMHQVARFSSVIVVLNAQPLRSIFTRRLQMYSMITI